VVATTGLAVAGASCTQTPVDSHREPIKSSEDYKIVIGGTLTTLVGLVMIAFSKCICRPRRIYNHPDEIPR
jgi:hypothetical protein